MNIIDLHTCLQGEGVLSGTPHILIRVSGCNLRCAFGNSICDTPYSSYNPEKGKHTFDDVRHLIKINPQIDHILLTGGEPLLYPDFIARVCEEFTDHFITVETNGTLDATQNLLSLVDFWSISPKLPSQLLTPEKSVQFNIPWTQRKVFNNTYLARKIIDLNKRYQLKYVVGTGEDFEAVESHILKVKPDKKVVWLMPSGDSEETLRHTRQMVADYCIATGYNYTDRLQYVIYGNKREA